MFRNQYDNDVSIWSPQGRIHQIEYAMEAVKQGSATIGIKSSTHVVLVALKRAASELSAHQNKIIPIDNHIAISIAGLTADARLLSKVMRSECLNSKYAYDTPLPVARLVSAISDKMQIPTQVYGRRPYGVGILIAGYDDAGPHLFQTCPSANFFDCKCMAIGARSQSARTYLEKLLDEFPNCTPEELIKHGLTALRETLPNEQELNTKNSSVCLVGKDQELEIFNDDAVAPYVHKRAKTDLRARKNALQVRHIHGVVNLLGEYDGMSDHLVYYSTVLLKQWKKVKLALLDTTKGGRQGKEEAKPEADSGETSMEQDTAAEPETQEGGEDKKAMETD